MYYQFSCSFLWLCCVLSLLRLTPAKSRFGTHTPFCLTFRENAFGQLRSAAMENAYGENGDGLWKNQTRVGKLGKTPKEGLDRTRRLRIRKK